MEEDNSVRFWNRSNLEARGGPVKFWETRKSSGELLRPIDSGIFRSAIRFGISRRSHSFLSAPGSRYPLDLPVRSGLWWDQHQLPALAWFSPYNHHVIGPLNPVDGHGGHIISPNGTLTHERHESLSNN